MLFGWIRGVEDGCKDRIIGGVRASACSSRNRRRIYLTI